MEISEDFAQEIVSLLEDGLEIKSYRFAHLEQWQEKAALLIRRINKQVFDAQLESWRAGRKIK